MVERTNSRLKDCAKNYLCQRFYEISFVLFSADPREQTIRRMVQAEETILLVQDIVRLNHSTHLKTEKIGYIGDNVITGRRQRMMRGHESSPVTGKRKLPMGKNSGREYRRYTGKGEVQFHYVLKSGRAVEKPQERTMDKRKVLIPLFPFRGGCKHQGGTRKRLYPAFLPS